MGGNNRSEVSQLRGQIEREHQMAMWAKEGIQVGTAKHRFISRRMDAIGKQQEALAQLIGEAASVAIICEVFESDSSPSPGSH